MEGWFSLDQVHNWLCFHRNAMCFMGSCSPLPRCFIPVSCCVSPACWWNCQWALGWEMRSKNFTRSGHSVWVKREIQCYSRPPKKQTNLYMHIHAAPSRCKKISMDSQFRCYWDWRWGSHDLMGSGKGRGLSNPNSSCHSLTCVWRSSLCCGLTGGCFTQDPVCEDGGLCWLQWLCFGPWWW